jgi:hypothetical protein
MRRVRSRHLHAAGVAHLMLVERRRALLLCFPSGLSKLLSRRPLFRACLGHIHSRHVVTVLLCKHELTQRERQNYCEQKDVLVLLN